MNKTRNIKKFIAKASKLFFDDKDEGAVMFLRGVFLGPLPHRIALFAVDIQLGNRKN
jgi:hypothetical protein